MLKGLHIVEGSALDLDALSARAQAPVSGPRRGAELVTDPAALRRPDMPAATGAEAPADEAEMVDMAFFPLRGYHVDDCLPVIEELRRKGARIEVVETDGWRDGGNEVARTAARHGLGLTRLEDFLANPRRVRCAVLWNDWDLLMRLVAKACHEAGTETVAWVEGIQDYQDVDRGSGLMRFPYMRSKHVILPGEFDARYFRDTDQILHRGEIVRVNMLWTQQRRQAPAADRPRALINSNFSYGVLEEHRDSWVTQAVNACLAAGFEPVISRHPFDTGTLYPQYTTARRFGDVVHDCTVTIQRFASGILEALALGVPVVYFNPHGERIDKFKAPEGAYRVTDSRDALEAILSNRHYFWDEVTAQSFLRLHAGLPEGRMEPGDRIIAVLLSILRRAPEPAAALAERLADVPERGASKALRDRIIDLGPFYGAQARQPVLTGPAPAREVHAPPLPQAPAGDDRTLPHFRFFLFRTVAGAAEWTFHDPAQVRRHVEAGGRGLVLYDDPITVLVETLEAGGDAAAMLAEWERSAERSLELLAQADGRLALVDRNDLAKDPEAWEPVLADILGRQRLPRELWPDHVERDPLLDLAAFELVQASPAARCLMTRLQAHAHRPESIPPAPQPDIPAALKRYHALRDACASLQTEIVRLGRAHSAARTRARELEAESGQLKETAQKRGREIETVRKANAALEAELDSERRKSAELAAELAHVYSSKSWRITGPLRGARRSIGLAPKSDGET